MAEEMKDNIQIPAQCLFICYHHALSLANICYIHSCLYVLHWNIPSISSSSASLPKVSVEFTVFTCLILRHTCSSFCSSLALPLPITWISMKLFHLGHLSAASHIGSPLKFIHSAFFVFPLPIQTFSVAFLFYLLYRSCFIKLGLFSLLWCCPTHFSLSAALNFTCWITLTHITVPWLTHLPAYFCTICPEMLLLKIAVTQWNLRAIFL